MSLAFPISIRAKKLDGSFDWLDFPLWNYGMKQAIEEFGENPYIAEYDKLPLDLTGKFGFTEHTPLWQIECVSRLLAQDENAERIVDELVMANYEKLPETPLELANFAMQLDNLPWVDYNIPIQITPSSDEESFGYHLANTTGLFNTLSDSALTAYFDFEKYGQEHVAHRILGMDGYLDTTCQIPSWNQYSWEDAKVSSCM